MGIKLIPNIMKMKIKMIIIITKELIMNNLVMVLMIIMYIIGIMI